MLSKEINGISLAYLKKGEGKKAAIFLHGNGESSALFAPYLDKIPFEGSVYAIDTRGHGESEYKEPFTIARFAEDVKAFIKSEKLTDVTLAGYSDGANIAFFCAEMPEVKRLYAVSGNLYENALKKKFLIPCQIIYALLFPLSFLPAIKRRRALLRLMLTDIGLDEQGLAANYGKTTVICADNDLIKHAHSLFLAEKTGNELIVFENSTHFSVIHRFMEKVVNGEIKL